MQMNASALHSVPLLPGKDICKMLPSLQKQLRGSKYDTYSQKTQKKFEICKMDILKADLMVISEKIITI